MALLMIVSFFFHIVLKPNDQCFDFEGIIYFQTVSNFRVLLGMRLKNIFALSA